MNTYQSNSHHGPGSMRAGFSGIHLFYQNFYQISFEIWNDWQVSSYVT